MSAVVTLTLHEGPQEVNRFVFRRTALCRVGRGSDCSIRLPNDDAHRTISRHHCLLEIDPPAVRVCDLGSLNGTYVNGAPIGRRHPECSPGDLSPHMPPAYLLKDGDEVQVGITVLRVLVEEGTEAVEDDDAALYSVPSESPGCLCVPECEAVR